MHRLLLTDASLASLFNEKCGNLQALCPHSQNDTGILYTKKLQNYLEALFPAEQEIQEIRQTFSHCIFLSYRKKDRKHAQALMQVIHENERLVDTAIWYDEFLTPGEDFNASIQNRIEKSDQFVMAMTSHMVCEKNYVQQIEYPFAQSLNKAILPVLVSGDPLDLKRLKDAFPQLPPVYEMNRAALYPPLSSLMGKIEDLDAKRLYCLGLAYLNGIDVETNYEKGVRMIERAAQRDELRAIRKLIAIYEEGLVFRAIYLRRSSGQRGWLPLIPVKKPSRNAQSFPSKTVSLIRRKNTSLTHSIFFIGKRMHFIMVRRLCPALMNARKQTGFLLKPRCSICSATSIWKKTI